MHYAHGYPARASCRRWPTSAPTRTAARCRTGCASTSRRSTQYGAVWPEDLPLTCRLGSDDKHPDGTQPDDAVVTLAALQEHGLDLADVSLGFNTDELTDPSFFCEVGFMNGLASRVRREVGLPVAASWNLGVPQNADRAVRDGILDVVLLGRPACPTRTGRVWAARELGHESPFSLVPNDWGHWLDNFRAMRPASASPSPPRCRAWSSSRSPDARSPDLRARARRLRAVPAAGGRPPQLHDDDAEPPW